MRDEPDTPSFKAAFRKDEIEDNASMFAALKTVGRLDGNVEDLATRLCPEGFFRGCLDRVMNPIGLLLVQCAQRDLAGLEQVCADNAFDGVQIDNDIMQIDP